MNSPNFIPSLDLSVIIATYNSGKRLPEVLKSVRSQNFAASRLEIIIADGGSKDNTLELAKEFGCVTIDNPRTEPVHAKFLAFHAARGRYLCFLDHDEHFKRATSFSRRLAIASANPLVKVILGSGYESKPDASVAARYINEFGDPFSFFIYRSSKDSRFMLNTFQRKYPCYPIGHDAYSFPIHAIAKNEILEVVAAGAWVDKSAVLAACPALLQDPTEIPHLLYHLANAENLMAVLKEDEVIHDSCRDLADFRTKIRWRIINNIFGHNRLERAGFRGRMRTQKNPMLLLIRQILFIPANVSLVVPILDGLSLAITRRSLSLGLTHISLSLFTAYEILRQLSRKVLRLRSPLTSYDGKSVLPVEPPKKNQPERTWIP